MDELQDWELIEENARLQKVQRKLEAVCKATSLIDKDLLTRIKKDQISAKKAIQEVEQLKRDMFPADLPVEVSYVLGFAFTPDRKQVLLMIKNRPLWMAGKLNGVGGKIEDGELPGQAMVREFKEETGILTDFNEFDEDNIPTWKYVGSRGRAALSDRQPGSYHMSIFAIELPHDVMTAAESAVNLADPSEPLIVLPLNMEILRRRGVAGLDWMAGVALDSLSEGFLFEASDPSNLPEVE